ncbi:unnamed protein product [Diamesa hyperborea]
MLRYCDGQPNGSCCTYNIETKLALHARQQLERSTRDAINKLSSILSVRAQKFNEFFKALLAESKEGFHAMFKQTYGIIYEQNSYVFSELFDELEGYYSRGKTDLAEAMDKFFNTLYQKMFTVINSQYVFDERYLECVSEHMKQLKPFGDVPDKLSVQVKRSFVATRTFAQALNSAAEVAKNMNLLKPPMECTAALTKMSTCGVCNGHLEKPCEQFCVNVMKGCLQQYTDLDAEWDSFVAQIEKVSERLMGPFNIVMVVEPINIKISEAIMNFQETGQDITKQVFLGCGKPNLGRRRRATHQSISNSNADLFIDDGEDFELESRTKRAANPLNQENRGSNQRNQEIKYEPIMFPRNENIANNNHGTNNNRGGGGGNRRGSSSNNSNTKNNNNNSNQNNNNNNENRGTFNRGKSDNNRESMLDKLVKDIRQKVKDSKKFWSNLPYQVCNNDEVAAPASNSDNCWNGKNVDRYAPIVNAATKNPEFPSSNNGNAKQSHLVAQQLFTMKTTISHLKNAYNGNDVEWSDSEDSFENYESGSGSGSGNDDDDETGSGLGPYEINTPPPKINVDSDLTQNKNNNNFHEHTNNNIDVNRNEEDDDDDVNNSNRGSNPTSSSPTLHRATSWRTKRAILTYFLPIVMCFFGGAIAEQFSTLL